MSPSRIRRYLLATALLVSLAACAWAANIWLFYFSSGQTATRSFEPPAQLETIELGNGLYAIFGAGGNITVSVGDDGILLVDTGSEHMGPKVLKTVLALGAANEFRLVNTHAHGDHTWGNAAFVGQRAQLFVHANAHKTLLSQKAAPDGLTEFPTIAFEDRHAFEFNGQRVELLHMPQAHTDGDVVVIFQPANVIAAGDALLTDGLPNLGPLAGSTLDGHLDAQTMLLALSDADTRIVPGHGPLADRAVLAAVRDDLQRVRNRLARLKNAGVPRKMRVLFHPLQGWPESRQVDGTWEKHWTSLAWDSLP